MINVAIVGTGGISPAHIQGYLQFPERCRIVALVDIVPEKAEKTKEKFNLVDAEVYDSHEKILGRKDIDLVDICTPPYVHASIAIDCMHSGKNVVSEKPMAASLEECDAMLKARDEAGVKLSIIAQNRFRQDISNVKKLLDSGIAGPVKAAQIDSFWWRGHSYYDLWWRGTWKTEGGGCTLNHAVHHIDMLLWMLGSPLEVNSVLANVAHDNAEVEDLSISILKYPGALAELTASVVHHGEKQEVSFQCEKARISAPLEVYASTPMANGFPVRNDALEQEIKDFAAKLPVVKYEGHTGQIESVLTSIEKDTPVAISGEDGRRTIELICSIFKSGSEHRPVKLPLEKDDPFYTVEGIMSHVPHFYEKTASVAGFEGDIVVGSSNK